MTFKIDLKWFKDDFKQKKNRNFFRFFFFHHILLGGHHDLGVFFNFFVAPVPKKQISWKKIEKISSQKCEKKKKKSEEKKFFFASKSFLNHFKMDLSTKFFFPMFFDLLRGKTFLYPFDWFYQVVFTSFLPKYRNVGNV